jgi:glycosyltransferase involved in cell wall biosynthesis
MKILILNWRDIKNNWGGGAEQYIHELAKRWVKLGHEVTLFCGQNYLQNLPAQEMVDGVRIIRKGGRYTLYIWSAWYYLTRLRNDCDIVVDAINGVPFFSPLYSRKPIVALHFHVHDMQFFIELPFPMSLIGYILEKFMFRIFYLNVPVVAISETTKRDLANLGISENKVDVVYPATSKNGNKDIDPQKIKRFSYPTLLYLGKVKRYKRVDMLVKLMPEILKQVPKARLLIAGWGTFGPYLTDISMKSLVKNNIKIIGPVSDSEKWELMSKSWVCVNPSLHEGWGIPVIEGNLFGTPTVSFNVPGLSESIKHGETGFLANTEEEFVEYVVKLLENASLRKRMSIASSKWAKNFDWDKSATKFLEVLRKYAK